MEKGIQKILFIYFNFYYLYYYYYLILLQVKHKAEKRDYTV